MASLEQRTSRRTRRRRIVGRGVALTFLAAVVATVTLLPGSPQTQRVVTVPPSSTETTAPAHLLPVVRPLRPMPPARPLPAVHHAPGARPIDWGRLRLWLPPGWQALRSAPSCPVANTVYLSTGPGSACDVVPQPPGTPVPYVQVEPFTATPPVGSIFREINGVAAYVEVGSTNRSAGFVTEDVPSLGVRLVVEGAGASVAATLGPSSYAALSDATYPVAVPASWKTVTYRGFQVRVPPSWPVRTLGLHLISPAGPGVYLGRQKVVPTLPPPPPGYVPPLGNYLWMQPYTASSGVSERRLRTGRVTLSLQEIGPVNDYTTTANLTASSGSRRISVTVGLGNDPSTAEAILSSIRLAK